MCKPYLRLSGELKARGVKVKDVAKLLDVSVSTASCKLNRIGGRDFKVSELVKICKEWDLNSNDIFFNN